MDDKYGKYCPVCYSSWKISRFNMHSWKDCLTCGLTAEDIVDNGIRPEKIPPVPNKSDQIDIEDFLDCDDWGDVPF